MLFHFELILYFVCSEGFTSETVLMVFRLSWDINVPDLYCLLMLVVNVEIRISGECSENHESVSAKLYQQIGAIVTL